MVTPKKSVTTESPEPVFKLETEEETCHNKFHKKVTSFQNFYICTLEQKLDSCISHIHIGDTYTLDVDIINTYKSITIQDCLHHLGTQQKIHQYDN
mmetsp:Transcript_39830/g.48527  ORF Transcript_39830/g.48527 Transcript_39830/m.48527 type:complete len:96 (+) Transcript_39830:294-581(+)